MTTTANVKDKILTQFSVSIQNLLLTLFRMENPVHKHDYLPTITTYISNFLRVSDYFVILTIYDKICLDQSRDILRQCPVSPFSTFNLDQFFAED